MARPVVPAPRTAPVAPAAAGAVPLRVVVAVDGSPASVRALVWALEFAASCDAEVEVVTAWPLHAPVLIGEVPGHFNDARWQAVAAQRSAVEQAASLLDGTVPTVRRLTNASPREALVEAAAGAALLVVGARRTYPTQESGGPTLAEALQEAVGCPVLEVSGQGTVSRPQRPERPAEQD